MKKRTGALCAGLLALGMAGAAQATLIDNSDGTVTDDSKGLMWLQNANLAATNIFDLSYDTDLGDHPDDSYGSNYTEVIRTTGRMNWGGALRWIDAMNAASYKGYDDWRLPTVNDIGDNGCNFANTGTDCGYNTDTSLSELAYMFHDILGNESWYNTDSTRNSTGCPDSDPWCLQSTSADGVNIDHLQSYVYWSGTEYAPSPNLAWLFSTNGGFQGSSYKDDEFYAWAVRSGE